MICNNFAIDHFPVFYKTAIMFFGSTIIISGFLEFYDNWMNTFGLRTRKQAICLGGASGNCGGHYFLPFRYQIINWLIIKLIRSVETFRPSAEGSQPLQATLPSEEDHSFRHGWGEENNSCQDHFIWTARNSLILGAESWHGEAAEVPRKHRQQP